MITRRSVLVSSLLASVGASVPHSRALASAADGKCPFPIDTVREVLGPELLRTGDAQFRAAAGRLALHDAADIAALWADEAWQATVREDFAAGRVVLVYGFVLSCTESVAYAAEALRA